MINLKSTLILLVCFLSVSNTFAHGDIHERIVKLTAEIKKAPDSAYLYFKRGKLYYQHEAYSSSLKDINQSIDLGYTDIEQKLLLSKNYFRLEDYDNALLFVNSILEQSPNNVVFLKNKARILFNSNHYESAALEFEKVIKYSSKTFPENYIEASEAWLLSGSDKGFENAIAVINLGIENLGQIISLYERKVTLYLKTENYDEAIISQNQIINILNRREHGYYKLAELYMLNNDTEKAIEALEMSKLSISKLPERFQNNSGIIDLSNHIKSIEDILNEKTITKPN